MSFFEPAPFKSMYAKELEEQMSEKEQETRQMRTDAVNTSQHPNVTQRNKPPQIQRTVTEMVREYDNKASLKQNGGEKRPIASPVEGQNNAKVPDTRPTPPKNQKPPQRASVLEDFSSPDDDDFEENTLSSHEKWQEVRSRKNKKH